MYTYTFLFQTKTRQWEETVEANGMFDAARKAKSLAVNKSKDLSTNIQFSFHHKRVS